MNLFSETNFGMRSITVFTRLMLELIDSYPYLSLPELGLRRAQITSDAGLQFLEQAVEFPYLQGPGIGCQTGPGCGAACSTGFSPVRSPEATKMQAALQTIGFIYWMLTSRKNWQQPAREERLLLGRNGWQLMIG